MDILNKTIGVVAPSGPLRISSLAEIENALNSYGFNVVFFESCSNCYKGYLAGEDVLRARDFERAFLDERVDIVMCLRGGYGAMRILDLIDFSIIKTNPKPFIGFSDITALHIAIYNSTKIPTFHGLMAQSSFRWDEFSYESLRLALEKTSSYDIVNPDGEEFVVLREGNSSGILVGGNLALIVSLLGTKYEIDTDDKILFIEDVGEDIYRLDRMLTQLKLAGKFDKCKGIIFGDFYDCNKSNEEDFELMELLEDRMRDLNIPCVANVKSGHCEPMITLPLGKTCNINTYTKKITVNIEKGL